MSTIPSPAEVLPPKPKPAPRPVPRSLVESASDAIARTEHAEPARIDAAVWR